MAKLAIRKSIMEWIRYIRFGARHKVTVSSDSTFKGREAISPSRPMSRYTISEKGIVIFEEGVKVKPAATISVRGGTLTVGKNTFINTGSQIACWNRIRIGSDCAIGIDVIIRDTDGHGKEGKPVIIHDHVWIAARVIILKGAEIGENSIVGAGAVVTGKKYPPRSLIVGNPAVVVRKQIDDWV